MEGEEQAARFRHAPGTSHLKDTKIREELSCHQRICDNQRDGTEGEGRAQAQQEHKNQGKLLGLDGEL